MYFLTLPFRNTVTVLSFLPGSRGVFCELRQSDRRMLDFYSKLGSFKPIQLDSLPQNILIMATSL